MARDPRPPVSTWGGVCWANDWVRPCVYLMGPGSFFLPLMLKTLPASAGDVRDASSVSGSRRSPGGGHGNPLQDCCLETPMDSGARRATVHEGHKESDMTQHTCNKQKAFSNGLKSESGSVASSSLRPRGLYSPWNSPGQNTGWGSPSLSRGIFPTQGLNPGLPHCRRILYQLSHQGS